VQEVNNLSAVNNALSQNAFGYIAVDAGDGRNMTLCYGGSPMAMFPLNTDSDTVLRAIAANTTNGRPTWGQNFKDATAWGAGMAVGEVGVAAVTGIGLGILGGLFGSSDS
jgi:hypothetical protein